jgi:hypothetical protein
MEEWSRTEQIEPYLKECRDIILEGVRSFHEECQPGLVSSLIEFQIELHRFHCDVKMLASLTK